MDSLNLKSYDILEDRQIADVQSRGLILRHKKSGARIAALLNDDDNKVFYIGFRTPPEDETGVPHIIEHTTLCGSEKFPVKDPFVELVKGSLNTFLNAMTYPEKTVYPLASYNDKDFNNLMDVYLDAVFHPNIVKYKEIFMQEGWHYELESEDAPLTINGVVYNEMKGAYSSPESVLQNHISRSLFPDNAYSKDSGGNPKYIPELTYEEYLAFYHKYYHPSNSYIYLYGDMDLTERLDWLDREYLCHYDRTEVDSEIPLQKPFKEMTEVMGEYPISTEESEEDQTYLSYNKVVDTALNKELCQAFSVLDYALVSAPGAPIRQALIDAGIGQDVYGSFDSGQMQPVFSVISKNANVSDKERFVDIIEASLREVAEKGINPESLLAAINSSEFRFREADFGQYPKGLLYGLQCLDSWMFDDTQPFLYLECLDTYDYLKKQIGTGYFEQLIRSYLLENTHGSIVVVAPKKGLNGQEEAALEQSLAEYKAGMTPQEIQELIAQTVHLKQYQEEPSPEEDLRKIRMLTRADLKREASPFSNIEEKISDVPVVRHEVETNGINYITMMFDLGDIPQEEIPVLGLFRAILGYMDTESYRYMDLSNAVNIYTGGISGSIGLYPDVHKTGKLKIKYEIRMKVLERNMTEGMALADEILCTTKLSDTKRLGEIIAQIKSRLQESLSSSGHTVAALRALSYESAFAWYQDATHGIRYYRNVCALEEQLKQDANAVADRLERLMKKVFSVERLMISFTANSISYEKAVPFLKDLIGKLPGKKPSGESKWGGTAKITLEKRNEGFTNASQIQYVARGGSYRKHGYSYSGYLRILKIILSYDYMWINIRVKGGAYGCMSYIFQSGETCFVSYRDPNLSATNAVYEGIPEYLQGFRPDERDMTKYIIGTFGSMDTPLYPEAKGSRSMTAYLQNLTLEDVQKERDEILYATPEDIRALAEPIRAVLSDDLFCVIGNENAIRREAELFEHIQGLYEE